MRRSGRDDENRVLVIRARLSVGVVWAFAAASGGLGISELATGAAGVTNYASVVARFEVQYEALRGRLPTRGSIGFVTETSDQLAYVLAHYYLAPLIVESGSANADIVVGHFESRDGSIGFLNRRESALPVPASAELHAIVVKR